jgi:hypothetical protein
MFLFAQPGQSLILVRVLLMKQYLFQILGPIPSATGTVKMTGMR